MASGTRCDRCGTMVTKGRVICPSCDNVVDLSFLGEATRGELAESPFSEIEPEPPTLSTKKPLLRTTTSEEPPRLSDEDSADVHRARTAPVIPMADSDENDFEVPTLRMPVPQLPSSSSGMTPTTAPNVPLTKLAAELDAQAQQKQKQLKQEKPEPAPTKPRFLNEETDADFGDFSDVLKSSTDALVLGDAGDIVESLWVEQSITTAPEVASLPRQKPASNADFLTAPTSDGMRDFQPVQVFIGGDIAKVIEKDAVLQKTGDAAGLLLSSFEVFVLEQIDGKRPVARIQKRMGLSDGDLRIALALLVDKKLVARVGKATPPRDGTTNTVELDAPAAPPPPSPAPLPRTPTPPTTALPRTPTKQPMQGTAAEIPRRDTPVAIPRVDTPPVMAAPVMPAMPLNMDYATALRTGLVVDDAGRSKAAALHAQCLRDLKNGAVARAYTVARMAHEAAPDVLLYKEILDDWNNFVSTHKTPDDARLHAQAVSAETAGDIPRAVALLKQAAQANPQNAAVWNRLGLLLATRMKDVDGALDAMTKAIELSPNDATFKNNFGKIAALAERSGKASKEKGGIFAKLFGR